MSNTILAAQVRTSMWLRQAVDRVRSSELGQGSAEYAGVIVVAVLIVTGLVTVAGGWGDEIASKVKERIDSIFTAGG